MLRCNAEQTPSRRKPGWEFFNSLLNLRGRFHRAHPDAGCTFQAQLVADLGSILDKADSGCGAQINATAAANAFFAVNVYHGMISFAGVTI